MKNAWISDAFLVIIVVLGMTAYSYAGSDRLIMSMTAERMVQENLVYVRFVGQDGATLESDTLKQMIIREQDCSSGHIFEMVKDYKIGYEPKKMLVGIYLYPYVWKNKTLCFNVPNLGKIEQSFNPTGNDSRSFQLKITP
jgi:hypothetical protein